MRSNGVEQRTLTRVFAKRGGTHTEWTFAKQKWQRTKNVVRGDTNFRTAEILPGFREKIYA